MIDDDFDVNDIVLNLTDHKPDSIADNIPTIFNFDSFIPFSKNLSLKEIIREPLEKLQEMKNVVCILVNPKKSLLVSDCKWNVGNDTMFSNLPDNLTASYLSQFIKNLQSNIINSKKSFVSLFKFNSGSDLKEIEKDPNRNLYEQLIKFSFEPNNNKCEIEKSISKLLTIEQTKLQQNSPSKYFIRVVCLISSPSSPIETDLLKSTLSTFTNHSLFNSIVVNFLLMENDYYFKKYTKNNEEIKTYCDFKEDDDCLINSTKKMKYLMKVYDNGNEEFECKNLSDGIFQYGKGLLSNSSNNKISSLLLDLESNFGEKTKVFFDLQDAIFNSLNTYSLPETRKEKKEEIKKICNKVIEEDLIMKAYKSLKEFLEDFYNNKGFKDLYEKEVKSKFNEFNVSINKFEEKIIFTGKKKFFNF